MPQETLVLKVPRAEHEALRARLGAGPFEVRPVPHAVISVKGEGTVATLYTSGKFVVQGVDPLAFVARWTDLEAAETAAPAKAAKTEDPPVDVGVPVTGSDEAGKGDFLGPLVVAAVRVPDEAGLAQLKAAGVTDSKALSDGRALKLGAALRGVVEHAVVRLDPAEYNGEYDAAGTLNPLLASLHGRVLAQLAQPGEAVVVDQFERRGLVRSEVAPLDVRLTEVPRAERHAAVAAASILARQEFLLGLRELSEMLDVELRKGAGEPADLAGAEVVRAHGWDGLARAAKLHFKNVEKVRRIVE